MLARKLKINYEEMLILVIWKKQYCQTIWRFNLKIKALVKSTYVDGMMKEVNDVMKSTAGQIEKLRNATKSLLS